MDNTSVKDSSVHLAFFVRALEDPLDPLILTNRVDDIPEDEGRKQVDEHLRTLPLPAREGFQLPPIPPTVQPGQTVIEQLIQNNLDVWGKLLDNSFCSTGFSSPAQSFNQKYVGYTKQDYVYLLDYVRFQNYKYLQDPDTAKNQQGLQKMISYVQRKLDQVAEFAKESQKMGITQQELDNVEPWAALLGYTSWQQRYAMTEDMYTTTVRTIPCIYGWNQIALNLEGEGEKGTYFYDFWYAPNLDPSSANKLSATLEDYRKRYESPIGWETWNRAFRQGCLMEIALFEAGLQQEFTFKPPIV